MTREMARFAPAKTTHETAANWALGLACDDGWGALCADDAGFAVVYGRPELLSDDLIRSAERHGLAQAFVMAYRESGSAFLGQLRGCFSIAVGLPRERRVLLATDHVGVEPIFYAASNDGVTFASSLPSLVADSRVERRISAQSIYHYLYFHVIPSPDTIYEGIRKLPPGHCLEFTDGRVSTTPYWQVRFSRERGRASFAGLQREFKSTIEAEVAKQVAEGGSVGCFLSGGTDSSTVAGMLARVTDEPAKTYSIGFDESGYDEMEYARIASRHFGTEHHEYYVTGDDVLDLVPQIATLYGEPYGNSSAVPSYYCAAMAKSDGVDTMLAGDGGDELFGGNSRYAIQKLFAAYGTLPSGVRDKLIEPVLFSFPYGDAIFPVRKARRYVEQARMKMPDRLESYNLLNMLGTDIMLEPSFLDSIELRRPLRYLSDVYQDADATTMMNRMLALDIKFILADNDLPKVNKMCELAGVRARFPLLSDALVDFSASLPVDQKVRFLKLRYFFKKALRDFLPREVITKSKHGFGLPIGRWLVSHARLRSLALDSLGSFRNRGVIRPTFIDDLIDNKLEEHADYYGTLVWIIMILEHWLDAQGLPASAQVGTTKQK